jgi:hypothetical protein
MFSDFAPISESGYRAQYNTDPAIRQGIQFLNDERSIVSELTPSLNLISQTNGSGIGSGKIIKGKILEGLTTTTTSPTATAPTTTAPVPALTPSTTTTQASPQVKAVSQQRIDALKNQYQYTLNSLQKNMGLMSVNAGGGIADNSDSVSLGPNQSLNSGEVRQMILGGVKYSRNNLDSIYNQLTQATNNNIILTNQEYDDIMNQLNDINAEIISNYQQLNEHNKSIDYVSPLAGAEETSTLSTQRYYVYILWFIVTIIVLYITISNLINPSSSTWSLAVSLILLIGLFAFLVYNNLGSWYTKVDDDIRSIQLPSFDNLFNFDPLVSIKYTS